MTKTYDVAVFGGGSAGVFAAISAARTGAHTVLIEKNGLPGGTMTAGGVAFPGLFHAWGRQIIDGPCFECVRRTRTRAGREMPAFEPFPAHHWENQIALDPFLLTVTMDEMLENAGVEIRYHTMAASLCEEENGYRVTVCGKEGLNTFFARALIDATGDANVCSLLGLPVLRGKTLQPATLIHALTGYDPEKLDRALLEPLLAKINSDRAFCFHDPDLFCGLKNGRIAMHTGGCDASTSAGKTELEIRARRELALLLDRLRKLPGLENLRVSSFAPEAGVRESVTADTLLRVTGQEYRAGVRYPDAVCYAFYPIDIHEENGCTPRPLAPGVVPTVPLRALIAKNAHSLLVAGRAIGSDREAFSALRVQATCMATGQAAGVAAAIAAQQNVPAEKIPYASVCGALRALGAIVPEAV